MKITVHIIGGQSVPPGVQADAKGTAVCELAPGARLSALMEQTGLPEGIVTMVNSRPVPKPDRAAHELNGGDEVTVFPPLKGG
ncbi:MAG: sulfur carrier protein ThiS [Rhodospirillales bacterium]